MHTPASQPAKVSTIPQCWPTTGVQSHFLSEPHIPPQPAGPIAEEQHTATLMVGDMNVGVSSLRRKILFLLQITYKLLLKCCLSHV